MKLTDEQLQLARLSGLDNILLSKDWLDTIDALKAKITAILGDSDFCDVCNKPQMVLPNGEHNCKSVPGLWAEIVRLTRERDAEVAAALERAAKHLPIGKVRPITECSCGWEMDHRTELFHDAPKQLLSGSFEDQWINHIRALITPARSSALEQHDKIVVESTTKLLIAEMEENCSGVGGPMFTKALERVKAQARLEEHDAMCEECKFHIDAQTEPVSFEGPGYCDRHKELEAAAGRK